MDANSQYQDYYQPQEPALVRKNVAGGYTEDNVEIVCRFVATIMGQDENESFAVGKEIGTEEFRKLAKRVQRMDTTTDDRERLLLFTEHTGITKAGIRKFLANVK